MNGGGANKKSLSVILYSIERGKKGRRKRKTEIFLKNVLFYLIKNTKLIPIKVIAPTNRASFPLQATIFCYITRFLASILDVLLTNLP